MEYIILIVAAYFCLSFVAKVLRHFMKRETVALWIIAFVFMLIPHWDWVGLLILGWRYLVIPFSKHQEKREREGKSTDLSNNAVMWMIPIFWPFLIAKTIFGLKDVKKDTSYADWEEHKKRNAK
jgi:predicted membrane protein